MKVVNISRFMVLLGLITGVFMLAVLVVWIISKRIETHIVEDMMNTSKTPFNKLQHVQPSAIDTNGLWVFFTFGQSNAANYGQVRHKCRHEVYNFYRGKLVKAADPLWGATGSSGSPWTLMADQLIEQGYCKRIILVACAVGGSEIKEWSRGYLSSYLEKRMLELRESGLTPDFIFWHQGETDNLLNTTKDEYEREFSILHEKVRRQFSLAPLFVGIATYSSDVESLMAERGISHSIQQAQQSIIEVYPDVFSGANSDLLNKTYQRYDGLHFSGPGMHELANMWVEAIKGYFDAKSK